MRTFHCPQCRAQLYFENSVCLRCGRAVGYHRADRRMVLIDPEHPPCVNANRCACNWIADAPFDLCFNCRLTRTRPADADLLGLQWWSVAETAKRRLVFGLDELRLPVTVSDGYHGLAFDLLSSRLGPISTGYHNGVVTLDLAESDDEHREQVRRGLREPYRTVLGNVRHEIGHYYAELLALTTPRRAEFRTHFGVETASYDEARRRHYADRPRRSWAPEFVSAYAAMHPLEDFAEVFAHFLLIADTLQSAAESGLIGSAVEVLKTPMADVVTDSWLPLTRGLNQAARSLGQPDPYPYVLTDQVIDKLAFIADLIATSV